jgi:multidrug efflux system membrane fusion protein
VLFAIPSTYVQAVVKKFDAGESLPIEAYDRSSNERFGHGSLLSVDNRFDTATGTLTCKAEVLPDGGNLMIPGLMLNIRMLLEVQHGLVLVPTAAVQHDPEGAFVWVIRPDQTAGRRRVAIGTQEELTAGIQAGLSPGELVPGLSDSGGIVMEKVAGTGL